MEHLHAVTQEFCGQPGLFQDKEMQPRRSGALLNFGSDREKGSAEHRPPIQDSTHFFASVILEGEQTSSRVVAPVCQQLELGVFSTDTQSDISEADAEVTRLG